MAFPARAAPTPPLKAYQSENPDHVTVAVVGINDFHGHVMHKERKLPDGRVVKSGGAPVLTTMLRILRDEMKGNVLLVDAGDEWQGSLESNQVKGSIVIDYFNRIGMNVATLGNHEFDFGVDNLKAQVKRAQYPYVTSNIFEKKTGRRVSAQTGWSNVYPSKMFTVADMQIGVIGGATQETPKTTFADVVAPYEFRNPTKILEEESRALRKQGASAVLLTSHFGSRCEQKPDLKDWRFWREGEGEGTCAEDEEANQVFSKMAKGTLDGAIIGHTHRVVHHWLHGIPSIEDEAFNQYFNIIYLTFDRRTKKLLPNETRIEGLIPICADVFENLHHCDATRLPDGFSPGLEHATFHGHVVVPDPEVEEWLVPILKSTEKFRTQVLATSDLPLTHSMYSEGAMGNLIADVFREKAKADFALMNARGTRTSLDAGNITLDGLYRALPFENHLSLLRLTGKQVKAMVRIGVSGSNGIASLSGLRIKIIPVERPAPKEDLDGDGKIEPWEVNRLLSITREDGSSLVDDREYTLATYDFLVNGGENYGKFMNRIPKSKVNLILFHALGRELVMEYLQKVKKVNTKARPLVDPAKPRIILVN